MKAVLLKNVKKGEVFTLTDKVKYNEEGEVLVKYVWVRFEYNRTTKRYEAFKYENINIFKSLKGDRIVYTDFIF